MTRPGKVYLVGAGPGDPGLITMRGVELLAHADCVIYDKLANPALLRHAPQDAELIAAGKRAGAHSFKQNQINELLLAKARAGNMVVRLKGGDPCIFGRGAEEALELAAAGIEFEIVPGITAAIGASEYAGIMLTNREYSSAVAFITGHEAQDKDTTSINWQALAAFEGMLVFYMGIGSLEMISRELIEHGMNANTPTAVVADATLPTQRTVTGTIAEISQICLDANIEPPALVIVGKGALCDKRLEWFSRKTLFGQRIIVTRDSEGNARIAQEIAAQGGSVIEFDGIEFKDLTGEPQFEDAVAKITECDWIIFTSANGVRFVFEALARRGKDARALGNARVAVIGHKSGDRLRDYGIIADFMPTEYTGLQLGRQLTAKFDCTGKKILLLRSAIATKELAQELAAAGAHVDDVAVYTTMTKSGAAESVISVLEEGKADWITFTSSSTVRGFFEQVSADLVRAARVKIASIGPATTLELHTLGFEPEIEAAEHTGSGLVKALTEYIKSGAMHRD